MNFKLSRIVSFIILTTMCMQSYGDIDNDDDNDNDSYGLKVTVDYLLWQAETDQLNFALQAPSGTTGENFFAISQAFNKNQCFKRHSGVRAKVGYEFCDDWDSALLGTHLTNRSRTSPAQTTGIIATPFNLIFGGAVVVGDGATSIWRSQLDRVDWEIGYHCNPCDVFDLRLYAGITWGRIQQCQNITFDGTFFGPGAPADLSVKKRNCFSGVGPRIGFETAWCLWHDIKLVSNASGALLYGNLRNNTQFIVVQEEVTVIQPDFIDCKRRLRPTAQLFLGLDWQPSWQCWECMQIDLGIGYEAQYWWNQWQAPASLVPILTGLTQQGDWTTHGLVAHFGIQF